MLLPVIALLRRQDPAEVIGEAFDERKAEATIERLGRTDRGPGASFACQPRTSAEEGDASSRRTTRIGSPDKQTGYRYESTQSGGCGVAGVRRRHSWASRQTACCRHRRRNT